MAVQRQRSRIPWALAAGIWIVYATAALTEGLIIFHPHSGVTRAVFQSFAENVDSAYRGDPYGDNLHKAFAVVDTFFGPIFCAAGVGLLRKKRWGLLLGLGCGLTSLALLTIDLLADVFAGFRNVLDPWVYVFTFLPYYAVATSAVLYSLRYASELLEPRLPRE